VLWSSTKTKHSVLISKIFQLRTRSPAFRRRRRSSSRSSSDSGSRSSSRRSRSSYIEKNSFSWQDSAKFFIPLVFRSPESKNSNYVPLGSKRISPNGKVLRGGLGNREGRGKGVLGVRGGRGMKRGGPSGLKVFDKSAKKRLKARIT
jgi:hypothetical protein